MPKNFQKIRTQLELTAAEKKQQAMFAKEALQELNKPVDKPGLSLLEIIIWIVIIVGGWNIYRYHSPNIPRFNPIFTSESSTSEDTSTSPQPN